MSTSEPSGILIHPAVWPQQTWTENWGLFPFFGEEQLGPHLKQCGRAKAYLHAKFILESSNRLVTIGGLHQRYRQTGQTDRQRSDSIWRTLLQTVAQKHRNMIPTK